jgi:hypothetical protein
MTNPGISVRILGVPEFEAALAATVVRVAASTELASKAAGLKIVDLIRSHMDGRPGPNRISGTLFDSIRSTSLRVSGVPGNVGGWASTISANTDYARRIEFGFRGSDAKGRVFNQSPFPYFEPGLQDAVDRGVLRDDFETAWAAALLGA